MLAGTMCAAVKGTGHFHPMTDDAATTMRTCGRQCMDGTFETVKDVRMVIHPHFEAFVVGIAAYFARCSLVAERLLFSFPSYSMSGPASPGSLGLLDVLLSRPLLCWCWLVGPFRDIGPILGLEAVTAHVHRFRSQFLEQIFRHSGIADQPVVLDQGIILADQPFGCRPRSAGTLTCHPLQMTFVADILCAKGSELILGTDLNMIVLASPGGPGFLAPAPFRL
jgi:hypothetical protein